MDQFLTSPLHFYYQLISSSSSHKFQTQNCLISCTVEESTKYNPRRRRKQASGMEVKRRTARTLVSRLLSDSDQTRIAALCELRLLSKSDPDIRPLIAAEGAVPILSGTLYSGVSIARDNAAASILNLSISARDAVISTPGILDSLSHVLSLQSPSSSSSAAAILFSLLIDESYRKTVGSRRDILTSLIDIITNPNSPIRSLKDALNALFGVALYPPNRGILIDLGVIKSLFSLVGQVDVAEDATAVIGLMAGCEAAGDAFQKVSGVQALVDLIDPASGVSRKGRENAVSAMLNLGKFSGDGMKDEIRRIWGESRGFGALIEMVETGNPKEKSKAKALIRALDVGDDSGPHSLNLWSMGSSNRVSNSMTSNSSY